MTSHRRLRAAPLVIAMLGLVAARCEDGERADDTPLTVETRVLPPTAIGARYAVPLEASGGTGAYSWSAHGGLPAGLVMDADSGILRGTPAAAGQYAFMVQVSDGRGVARRLLNVSIATGRDIGIAADAVPTATFRTPFSATLQPTGGVPPYTWSVSAGSLPPGLALDAGSGTIAGTPIESGAYHFSVAVRDAGGATDSRVVRLQVNAPPAFATGSLRDATVGRDYADTLQVSGGTAPYAWIVTNGGLPGGLRLDPGTGAIAGTPTATGSSWFTVRLADAAGASVTGPFSITVAAPLAIPATTPSTLTVERPFTMTLPGIGGTPPYAWNVLQGSLPPGLTLDASGAIAGTPMVAGTFEFVARVTDAAADEATRRIRLVVVSAPAIASTLLPAGRVGRAYRVRLRRIGGTAPFVWTAAAGALPTGLTLDAGTGQVSGTPSDAGRSVFTVRLTDAMGAVSSRQLTIEIK